MGTGLLVTFVFWKPCIRAEEVCMNFLRRGRRSLTSMTMETSVAIAHSGCRRQASLSVTEFEFLGGAELL